MKCFQCPRSCGIERAETVGRCGTGEEFLIARAAPHFWEEPCVSGTRGSGTVFFSGCNLGCVFCQNEEISHGVHGASVSPERLKEIFFELKAQGVHNLNLVTPSHYTEQLIPLLRERPLPVVWNSSAYEKVGTLQKLRGLADVFLPDFKYGLPDVAAKLARAEDYPEIAKKAILEMFDQTGPYRLENGLIRSGVIVRHLILPGFLENTYAVLDWIAETFRPGEILFSLMSQYTPYRTLDEPSLNRRLTREEYIRARNYMLKKQIREGFVQELSSAKEEYTPAFDLTGVKEEKNESVF